jgi:hypothetical protein
MFIWDGGDFESLHDIEPHPGRSVVCLLGYPEARTGQARLVSVADTGEIKVIMMIIIIIIIVVVVVVVAAVVTLLPSSSSSSLPSSVASHRGPPP